MAEQQIQVNVDYLRTTRVHICMPCYGGMLTESTFMSYIKWANTCRHSCSPMSMAAVSGAGNAKCKSNTST